MFMEEDEYEKKLNEVESLEWTISAEGAKHFSKEFPSVFAT